MSGSHVVEGLPDVAKVIVAPPTRGRCDIQGEVGDAVRGWRLGWLLEASRICDEQAAQSRRRGRRRRQDDLELRVIRAERLVQVGELSSARQVLEGEALAPGNEATLRQVTDASGRPPQPREPSARSAEPCATGCIRFG